MVKARHLTSQPDEGKPTCQRCERGGHNCQGYPHPLRVVFDRSCPPVPPISQGGGSTSNVEDTTGNEGGMLAISRSTSRSTSRRPSTELLPVSHSRSRRPSAGSVGSVQEELTTRSLLREPDPLIIRDEIYSSFLVNNLLVHVDIGRGAILAACEKRSPMTDDSVQGTHSWR